MKRTLALLGLIAIGVMLLVQPDQDPALLTAETLPLPSEPPVTTGAPPDPGNTAEETPPATTTAAPELPPATSSTAPTTEVETTTTTTMPRVADGVIAGDAVYTEFGYFQVEVVIDDGVVIDITTVDEPRDRRSRRINRTAIPIYTADALETQSSEFDVISGATVTWQAWGESLESALEQAGIG